MIQGFSPGHFWPGTKKRLSQLEPPIGSIIAAWASKTLLSRFVSRVYVVNLPYVALIGTKRLVYDNRKNKEKSKTHSKDTS